VGGLKFVLSGNDKKVILQIKNILTTNGYIYLGYSNQPYNLLRVIRNYLPDIVVIDIGNRLGEYKPILRIIDDDLLCLCILIIEKKQDDIMEFISSSRTLTWATKVVYYDNFIQMLEMALLNFRRVVEYEEKLKELNKRLEERKIIEKAKWLLVKKQNMSEDVALDYIRKKARDNRVSMVEIANAIILAYDNI